MFKSLLYYQLNHLIFYLIVFLNLITIILSNCFETNAILTDCSLNINLQKLCILKTTVFTANINNFNCVNLRTNDGLLIGKLNIIVREIYAKCKKKSQYFTRKYSIKTKSIRRCAHAGSCNEQFCNKLNLKDYIPEFDDKVNSALGYSHCLHGDSSYKCFHFWSKTCIFYKNYLEFDENEDIFEVFNCSKWDFQAQIGLEYLVNTKKNIMKGLYIKPNVMTKIDDMKIGISINVIKNQEWSLLLNQKFIESFYSKKISILKNDYFEMAQVKCKNWNCEFPDCNCYGTGKDVNCNCVKDNLKNNIFPLPLILENYRIEQVNKDDLYIIGLNENIIIQVANLDL